MTNADKIFQAVINVPKLVEFGMYDVDEYRNVSVVEAINDENVTIAAVAKIVQYSTTQQTQREMYNKISNYLINCVRQ